jgi:hypothetical protein
LDSERTIVESPRQSLGVAEYALDGGPLHEETYPHNSLRSLYAKLMQQQDGQGEILR